MSFFLIGVFFTLYLMDFMCFISRQQMFSNPCFPYLCLQRFKARVLIPASKTDQTPTFKHLYIYTHIHKVVFTAKPAGSFKLPAICSRQRSRKLFVQLLISCSMRTADLRQHKQLLSRVQMQMCRSLKVSTSFIFLK